MGQFYFHDGARLLMSGTCADGLEERQQCGIEGAVLQIGAPPCDLANIPIGYEWRIPDSKLVPIAKSNDALWEQVRNTRKKLFEAMAWRVEKAAELGTPLAPEWLEYRQALRDITLQADPANITWPTPPEEKGA